MLEAIKTAFYLEFEKLISIVKSGIIGEIKNVEACFIKLLEGDIRELNYKESGGIVTELASYPLLAIIKLFEKPENVEFCSYFDKEKNRFIY